MDQMEEEQEKREDFQKPSPKFQKRTESPSAVREKDSLPVEKKGVGYSGPQWGLSEAEIEYLFKNSKDFVCITEYGGHFQRLNQTWKHLLGWEINELLETPYINFVHPEDVEKTLEYEKKIVPAGLINRYRCKDGSYRCLDWIGLSRTKEEPISTEGSNPLSIARDITLRKFMEKELQQKLKKISDDQWYTKQKILEAIMEIQTSHVSSIFYKDEQSASTHVLQVILQNSIKLSESEFGYICEITSDQLDKSTVHYIWEGNPLIDPNKEEQETTKKLEGLFNNFIEDIVSTKKPLMINDIKNYPKKIEISPDLPQLKSFLGVPIIIQDKLLGIVGLFNCAKDINKNLMEELDPIFSLSGRILNEKKMQLYQLAQKQAEAANTAKSNFLAHMSHEIRTPLTGLLGMLELIDKEYLHEEDLSYLQIAHRSGLALLSILNDILDISKIEAGQLNLETLKFNPVSVAQEVTQLLLLDAEKKGVDLNLTTSPRVPLYLMGDPTRLRQIFFNLVGNAIKFTSKGSVLVSLDGRYENSHFIFVGSVTDTGIGISPEKPKRNYLSLFLKRIPQCYANLEEQV